MWYTPPWNSWIFSHSYCLTLFTPIEINLKDKYLGNDYVNSFATCIQMPNMKRPTSAMLPSINETSHWISHVIYSMSCQNTNIYLMHPLESTCTKRVTLNSNLELSWCIIMLILFFTYTDKLSRTWLHCWTLQPWTTWGQWVSLPCLHYSKKRLVGLTNHWFTFT